MIEIEIKFILTPKKCSKIDEFIYPKIPIYDFLSTLFNNVTKETFDMTVEDRTYSLSYKYSKNHLWFSIDPSSFEHLNNKNNLDSTNSDKPYFESAKILYHARNKLTNGKHRKDYYIIIAFDGASNYLCNKIYPEFNAFERTMKYFMFTLLLERYGAAWYESTVSSELECDLKERCKGKLNDDKLIETAIYQMTMNELIDFLFLKQREVDPSKIIDDELNTNSILELSKQDIIDILDTGRARSLWESLFSDELIIDDLQSKLEKIRNYRNQVAHSKEFNFNDYSNCMEILNEITNTLNVALKDIERFLFTEKPLNLSLDKLNIPFEKLLDKINQSTESISTLLNSHSPTDSNYTTLMNGMDSLAFFKTLFENLKDLK